MRVPYIALELPYPIQKSEIARWGRLLDLSEAPGQILETMHTAYWEAYTAWGREVIAPLWDESAIAAACDDHADPIGCAELHAKVLRERERVATQIAQRDGALLAQLEPLLSEGQRSRLYQIRDDRIRSRMRHLHFDHPAAQVDLVYALQYLDLLPEDAKAWLMTSYGQTLTSLWQRFDRDGLHARIESVRALARYSVAPADSPERREQVNRRKQVQHRVGDTEKRLVELNRLYADLLVDVLPPAEGAVFRETFFPRSTPIRTILSRFSRRLIITWEWRGCSSKHIRSVAAEYRSRGEAIATQMIRRIDDYKIEYARTAGMKPPEFQRCKDDLSRFAQERAALADETLADLASLLSEDQQIRIAAALETYRR